MNVPDAIRDVLPGATVRETRYGFEVGGFSMPPRDAQRILRVAGLDAQDRYGQTVVPDSEQQAQYALEPDGTLAPAAAEPTQTPQTAQDRLFTADPTIRGQLNMEEVDHA